MPMFMALFVVVVIVSHIETTTADEVFRSLPDGLIVQQSDQVRELRGAWTVYLAQPDPSSIYGNDLRKLQDNVRNMEKMLTQMTTDGTATPSRFNAMVKRLALILPAFQKPQWIANRRPKRGLVDGIGIIASKLFGIATEEQLEQLSKEVRVLLRQSQQRKHYMKDLYTLINNEHEANNETRNAVNQLAQAISAFQYIEERRWESLQVDMRLDVLETSLNMIESQGINLYHKILESTLSKFELEHAFVTEQTLPNDIYNEISRYVQEKGLKLLPPIWYHEHVQIELIAYYDDVYYYGISLPLVSHDTYSYVQFSSWPVPIDDNFTIRVDVKPKLAFHSRQGYGFEPKLCQGNDPFVCTPKVSYGADALLCERGLITSHENVKQKCSFTKLPFEKTEIHVLRPGTYIIITNGDEYTLSCEKQQQKYGKLTRGTYLTEIPSDCTIIASEWILRGVLMQSSNYTMGNAEPLDIKPINVTQFDPERCSNCKLDPRVYLKPLGQLDIIPDGPINDDEWDYDSVSNHAGWIAVAVCSCIIITGAVLYCKCVGRCNCKQKPRNSAGPREGASSDPSVLQRWGLLPMKQFSRSTVDEAPQNDTEIE